MAKRGTVEKTQLRRKLRRLAEEVLERKGWTVERLPGMTTSVRRISRDDQVLLISIRTSQDTWIAFPRTPDDTRWTTLSEVDAVVAASLDPDDSRFAKIHLIDAKTMRARFDQAYKARKIAGHKLELGRGVWLSLYGNDSDDAVNLVGAGAANAPETLIERVRLDGDGGGAAEIHEEDDAPLTIPEAKRRLAKTLGVDPGSIKITVEA